jgi:hypothetical protein
MIVRLLRLTARHPLAAVAFALAVLLSPLVAVLGRQCAARSTAAITDDPGLIVERLWLDSYPQEPTDKLAIWLFLDNGFGIFRTGSSLRFVVDVVSHDRSGDRLSVTILEENKKKETRYSIKSCDDKPPFDLCLTFESPPLGPAKLYGFKDETELARRFPGLAAQAKAAASARGARP